MNSIEEIIEWIIVGSILVAWNAFLIIKMRKEDK